MPLSLPSDYDALIEKYRGAVPFDFIKVLIKHESDYNPKSDMGLVLKARSGTYFPGAAKGLMQIVQSVRQTFNERFMTSYTPNDLFDPEVSIKLGTFTLNNIVLGYARNHPKTLAPDWKDRRWVELFLFGWNAGYSESGGVGKVVSFLEKADIPKEKITIDNVCAMAEKAGAAKYLSDTAKAAWCKKVAANFLAEVARRKDSQKNVT
jgi:Transglycosylase SLT domain